MKIQLKFTSEEKALEFAQIFNLDITNKFWSKELIYEADYPQNILTIEFQIERTKFEKAVEHQYPYISNVQLNKEEIKDTLLWVNLNPHHLTILDYLSQTVLANGNCEVQE
jgi:hypothetical protein